MKQLATFQVADLFFGIDVRFVQEVLRAQEITPVPLSNRVIQGLMNLRGQIITAVDLRHRLGLASRPETEEGMNVVVNSQEGIVSLIVDQIGDVMELDPETFEDAPETVQVECLGLVDGVYKLPSTLLLVLNVERTLSNLASN